MVPEITFPPGWLRKDVDRAAARIASGFMPDWRPIAQAKTDGTEYIGRLGHKRICLIWYFAPSSRTKGWCDAHGRRVNPTHFLPMPAEPE